MSVIIEERGWLFVQDDWVVSWCHPERIRRTWPTGIPAAQYPDLIGLRVRHFGGGQYHTDDGRMLQLENGGSTKASQVEVESIRAPARPGPWSWRDGKWVRL